MGLPGSRKSVCDVGPVQSVMVVNVGEGRGFKLDSIGQTTSLAESMLSVRSRDYGGGSCSYS